MRVSTGSVARGVTIAFRVAIVCAAHAIIHGVARVLRAVAGQGVAVHGGISADGLAVLVLVVGPPVRPGGGEAVSLAVTAVADTQANGSSRFGPQGGKGSTGQQVAGRSVKESGSGRRAGRSER